MDNDLVMQALYVLADKSSHKMLPGNEDAYHLLASIMSEEDIQMIATQAIGSDQLINLANKLACFAAEMRRMYTNKCTCLHCVMSAFQEFVQKWPVQNSQSNGNSLSERVQRKLAEVSGLGWLASCEDVESLISCITPEIQEAISDGRVADSKISALANELSRVIIDMGCYYNDRCTCPTCAKNAFADFYEKWETPNVLLFDNMPSEEYQHVISALTPLTLNGIAEGCRRLLPLQYRNCPWMAAYPNKDFGAIFTTEDQLNGYCAAYTGWHIGKLGILFDKCKAAGGFNVNEIAVVDWGCGQGFATIYLNEYLSNNNLMCHISEVVLIEPSRAALARAQYTLARYMFGNVNLDCNIRIVNKTLNDVVHEDIQLLFSRRVIHLFSNILDVEGISLKTIAENLSANAEVDNYILCISPFYPKMERRYDVFLSYFTPPLQFAQRGLKSGKVAKNDYTYFYQTFLLPAAVQDTIIHYTFFPAVKYRAGYALECVFDVVKGKPEAKKALNWQTRFDVYAPFEFGVDVSTEINPVLAVLSNIICRGLPTFSSPRIEDAFEHVFACSKPKEIYGGTIHESSLSEEDKGRIVDCIVNKKLSGDDKIDQLVYTPLAIARFQKILVEVIGSGRLDLNAATWYILVEEGDVPFARLALDDFREMYGHLVALAQDSLLKLPEISLTVVPSTRFSGSPFAEQRSAVSSPPDGFDLVVEYSSVPKTVGNDEFSRYKVKNGCYFKVSSCKATDTVTVRRLVYTSEQIIYKPFCVKEANGLYANIPDRVQHLRYFLNLLFRKNDFRPGQLPILNRALQDKSVIGLLPTGGGKSLTYQLAAMLQPGVTLVVDPLISLMSDQFEGLRRIKIDCCTYINSSVNDAAERESKMEASRYLFVFISPERLCILRFRNRLQNMRDLGVYFAYGVIDEVHCVSEWGHDFRYSYLHLGRNLYQYVRPKQRSGNEHIALFGLTATASFDVLADVERDLSGEGSFPLDGDAIVRYENTNRLELQYKVVNIGESPNPWSKWDTFRHVRDHVPTSIKVASKWLDELNDPQAQKLIKERFAERENITDAETIAEIMATGVDVSLPPDWMAAGRRAGSAIVFCPHRQGVLGVNNIGGNSGVREILAVNLGLPQNDVSAFVGGDVLDEQNRFLSGRTSLMVATKAFGMGIDKPDVRFTCHVNHSSSLEGFVQEAGRAGRDRKMALAMILYCPTKNPSTAQTYAYEVINFFFQDNFRGKEFEKKIMFHLMTKNVGRWFSAADGDEASVSPQTVHGFMERLAAAPIGSSFIYVISTSFDSTADANQWLIDKWNDIGDRDAAINELGKKYRDYVMKAIYRMCCLRVIDDYTENYADNTLRIVATHYPDGEYYASLKRFLLRYYTEERANTEVEKAKHMRGQNEVQRCLAFLTEFVYEKIAMKKRHAMRDMESFCQLAIQSKKNWLETNEDLKDYIYYYFNSKYAREGYQTDAGEPFSLKDDTDEGKFCSFDIVFKYIRVINDDVTGADGSPKDNIKHLLGAVRLIRRALTDTNPALSLLNVFCLLFLRDETKASEVLQKELWKSYHDAYCDFREREGDVLKFLANMKRFVDEMVRRNVIGEDKVLELSQWQAEAECVFQERWLKDFSKKFTR